MNSIVLSAPPQLPKWEGESYYPGTGSRIRWSFETALSGDELTRLSPLTFHRIACLLILTRLDNTAIAEAFESLRDIYAWQAGQNEVLLGTSSHRRLQAATVRRASATPFVYPDEE